MAAKPKKPQRKQDTRFKPGQSGNPNGRPAGSRNAVTLACEQLLDGQAGAITQKAVDMALAGDSVALRLCIERIFPPRKDRPVSISLPKVEKATDIVTALGAVIETVSSGEITPSEGAAVAGILETKRRAIETVDLEQRIAALEATHGQQS